jgi:hypothetical protein
MTKYSKYQEIPQENPSKKPLHPIWRGIGCALMIFIPLLSYGLADFFVKNAKLYKWVIIPGEIILPTYKDPLILVRVLYTAIFIAILYLILTVITFVINRLFGAPRYGPQDVPLDKVDLK